MVTASPTCWNKGRALCMVLLGNGDGTFQAAHQHKQWRQLDQSLPRRPDRRRQGRCASAFYNNLVVYLSNGDGTFAAGVSYSVGNTSFGPVAITLGDFNGDRIVDVAISLQGDNVPGQEIVLLGNGDGTFQSGKTSTGVFYPASVVAGDFNNDGKLDLVISSQNRYS